MAIPIFVQLLPVALVALWFAVPLAIILPTSFVIYLVWTLLLHFRVRQTYYSRTLPEDVAGSGPKRSLNVCVIGAGAAGLVCVKELLAEGHTVTCFEKYAAAGGVFLYDDKKGGVYDSTTLTISNYTMSFSDFFTAGAPCAYWKHTEYYKYLMDYIEHFNLRRATFHYNTAVDTMERPGGMGSKWRITVSGAKTGVFEFDAVAVCNGTHQFPRRPVYPGEDTSPIAVVHSETYKRAHGDARFEGKRVVTVGVGETGADLAAEVAEVASKAFVSFRKAPFVIPRYPWNLGMPGDAFSSRAMFYCNHAYIEALHNQDQGLKAALSTPFFAKWLKGFMGLGDPIMGKIAELADRSGGGVCAQFLTKNEAFVRSMLAGTLHEKPAIERLDGRSVVFTDGSREEVDTILLCTGYVDKFPFLKGYAVDNVRNLYKHAFHTEIGDSVAFVGFTRPGTGGVPPCAEMVARYFALLCSGARRLPDDWVERAQREAAMEDGLLRLSAGRVRSLLMYGDYMEAMAAHVGCQPGLLTVLLTQPRLWLHMMYGPMMAAHYRLRGPGADRAAAEAAILGGPVPTPLPFRVAQGVAALLGWVGGALAGFRPTSW